MITSRSLCLDIVVDEGMISSSAGGGEAFGTAAESGTVAVEQW